LTLRLPLDRKWGVTVRALPRNKWPASPALK
jgi:hypothetical protein